MKAKFLIANGETNVSFMKMQITLFVLSVTETFLTEYIRHLHQNRNEQGIFSREMKLVTSKLL